MRVCSSQGSPDSNGIVFLSTSQDLCHFTWTVKARQSCKTSGDESGRLMVMVVGVCGNQGRVEMWTDQITGAERSLVTVGRSLTVANGFPPLWRGKKETQQRWVYMWASGKAHHRVHVGEWLTPGKQVEVLRGHSTGLPVEQTQIHCYHLVTMPTLAVTLCHSLIRHLLCHVWCLCVCFTYCRATRTLEAAEGLDTVDEWKGEWRGNDNILRHITRQREESGPSGISSLFHNKPHQLFFWWAEDSVSVSEHRHTIHLCHCHFTHKPHFHIHPAS